MSQNDTMKEYRINDLITRLKLFVLEYGEDSLQELLTNNELLITLKSYKKDKKILKNKSINIQKIKMNPVFDEELQIYVDTKTGYVFNKESKKIFGKVMRDNLKTIVSVLNEEDINYLNENKYETDLEEFNNYSKSVKKLATVSPDSKKKFIRLPIVGFQYRSPPCKPEDILTGSISFEPEPTNKYSKNAIKVLKDEKHVGYIADDNCLKLLAALEAYGKNFHITERFINGKTGYLSIRFD